MYSTFFSRYEWIEGASVTLMEIVLGALRTRSANSLILMRNGASFCDDLPPEFKKDFMELDPAIKQKVDNVKEAITELFGDTGRVRSYSCQFDGKHFVYGEAA